MGIKSMKILHFERKIAEIVRWLRLRKGDDEAIQKYFVRMQKQNNQFFMQWMWMMKVNYECVLGICKMKGCI